MVIGAVVAGKAAGLLSLLYGVPPMMVGGGPYIFSTSVADGVARGSTRANGRTGIEGS